MTCPLFSSLCFAAISARETTLFNHALRIPTVGAWRWRKRPEPTQDKCSIAGRETRILRTERAAVTSMNSFSWRSYGPRRHRSSLESHESERQRDAQRYGWLRALGRPFAQWKRSVEPAAA